MVDGVLKTLTPSDHRHLKKELRGCEGAYGWLQVCGRVWTRKVLKRRLSREGLSSTEVVLQGCAGGPRFLACRWAFLLSVPWN